MSDVASLAEPLPPAPETKNKITNYAFEGARFRLDRKGEPKFWCVTREEVLALEHEIAAIRGQQILKQYEVVSLDG